MKHKCQTAAAEVVAPDVDALLDQAQLEQICPRGYYIALRVGFAFPLEEVNQLPEEWVRHHMQHRLMLRDPVIRWVNSNLGAVRWSALEHSDSAAVLATAKSFGLRFGAAVSCFDGNAAGERSYAMFVREDREFTDAELDRLHRHVLALHHAKGRPARLSEKEVETLALAKRGRRIKQIAYALGISESAVKNRLHKAREKLGAETALHAVAIATDQKLI